MSIEDLRSTRAKSGYKGVCPSGSKPKPWAAFIWNPQFRATLYLGCFRLPQQAARRVLVAYKSLGRTPNVYKKKETCKYGHPYLYRRVWHSQGRTLTRCDICLKQWNREYARIRKQRKILEQAKEAAQAVETRGERGRTYAARLK